MPTDRKASHNQIIPLPVDSSSWKEQHEIFFARFPVLENEQLACIHDHLSSRLSIRTNPTESSIKGYSANRCSVQWRRRAWRTLREAQNPLGWWLYLPASPLQGALPRTGPCVHPWTRDCIYLCWTLHASWLGSSARRSLSVPELKRTGRKGIFQKCSPDAREKILNPSCTDDIDAGPKDAWLWAHDNRTRLYYSLCSGYRTLRQCGYVLWDSARLLQSGFLDTAWHDWSVKTQKEEDDHDERKSRYEEMVASWKAKSQDMASSRPLMVEKWRWKLCSMASGFKTSLGMSSRKDTYTCRNGSEARSTSITYRSTHNIRNDKCKLPSAGGYAHKSGKLGKELHAIDGGMEILPYGWWQSTTWKSSKTASLPSLMVGSSFAFWRLSQSRGRCWSLRRLHWSVQAPS